MSSNRKSTSSGGRINTPLARPIKTSTKSANTKANPVARAPHTARGGEVNMEKLSSHQQSYTKNQGNSGGALHGHKLGKVYIGKEACAPHGKSEHPNK